MKNFDFSRIKARQYYKKISDRLENDKLFNIYTGLTKKQKQNLTTFKRLIKNNPIAARPYMIKVSNYISKTTSLSIAQKTIRLGQLRKIASQNSKFKQPNIKSFRQITLKGPSNKLHTLDTPDLYNTLKNIKENTTNSTHKANSLASMDVLEQLSNDMYEDLSPELKAQLKTGKGAFSAK